MRMVLSQLSVHAPSGVPVDQRGLPKLLEHSYMRPQVLRVACRLGTNNQQPKASGTFIDVQLKGAFQYPT